MASYIFGGDTGETPESLKRKREIANALAQGAVGRAPRNVGEGLSAIGQALAFRAIEGRANKAAAAGQGSADASMASLIANMGGGGAFPAAPSVPGSSAPDTASPQASAADIPTQRVDQAFAASTPDTGKGDRIATAAPAAGTNWLDYANTDAIRNQPLDPKLTNALSFLPDMGVTMKVFSGGQDATGSRRTGSHRHDHGDAADAFFYKDGRQLDWNNPQDVPLFQQIVERAKANGVTGFGAGEGYMRPGSMHIGFGTPAVPAPA